MELEVNPPVDEAIEQALAEVLETERAAGQPGDSAWERAARAEAVEVDDDYAFSPRSTRGATRA